MSVSGQRRIRPPYSVARRGARPTAYTPPIARTADPSSGRLSQVPTGGFPLTRVIAVAYSPNWGAQAATISSTFPSLLPASGFWMENSFALPSLKAPGSVLNRLGRLTADADRLLQSLCGMKGQDLHPRVALVIEEVFLAVDLLEPRDQPVRGAGVIAIGAVFLCMLRTSSSC